MPVPCRQSKIGAILRWIDELLVTPGEDKKEARHGDISLLIASARCQKPHPRATRSRRGAEGLVSHFGLIRRWVRAQWAVGARIHLPRSILPRSLSHRLLSTIYLFAHTPPSLLLPSTFDSLPPFDPLLLYRTRLRHCRSY